MGFITGNLIPIITFVLLGLGLMGEAVSFLSDHEETFLNKNSNKGISCSCSSKDKKDHS